MKPSERKQYLARLKTAANDFFTASRTKVTAKRLEFKSASDVEAFSVVVKEPGALQENTGIILAFPDMKRTRFESLVAKFSASVGGQATANAPNQVWFRDVPDTAKVARALFEVTRT